MLSLTPMQDLKEEDDQRLSFFLERFKNFKHSLEIDFEKLEVFLGKIGDPKIKEALDQQNKKQDLFHKRIFAKGGLYREVSNKSKALRLNRDLGSPFVYFRGRPWEDDITDLVAKHLRMNFKLMFDKQEYSWGGLLLLEILRSIDETQLINEIKDDLIHSRFGVSARNPQMENIDLLVKGNEWIIGIENKRDNYRESKNQTKREWEALLSSQKKSVVAIFLDESNRKAQHNGFKTLSYDELSKILERFKNHVSCNENHLINQLKGGIPFSIIIHNLEVFIDLLS